MARKTQYYLLAGAAALGLCLGCVELPVDPNAPIFLPGAPPPPKSLSETDPQILNALVDVLERVDKIKPDIGLCDESATPAAFCEILKVGSPIGYQLRNRYLNPGVAVAEALARDPDEALRKRLVEMARWAREPEVRTTALIGLARFHNPEDYAVFHEAVAHNHPAIRFGTLEALMVWADGGKHAAELRQKALPLLTVAWQNDIEPVLRVFCAQALARLGDTSGLDKLRDFLGSQNWLVRANAARYLGDFGEGKDYHTFVRLLDTEKDPFILAEYAIAALKLFPKSEEP
ncbi:MAG: HEAT repeat domain-containing protein [Elusimicrobiota bacterium]